MWLQLYLALTIFLQRACGSAWYLHRWAKFVVFKLVMPRPPLLCFDLGRNNWIYVLVHLHWNGTQRNPYINIIKLLQSIGLKNSPKTNNLGAINYLKNAYRLRAIWTELKFDSSLHLQDHNPIRLQTFSQMLIVEFCFSLKVLLFLSFQIDHRIAAPPLSFITFSLQVGLCEQSVVPRAWKFLLSATSPTSEGSLSHRCLAIL